MEETEPPPASPPPPPPAPAPPQFLEVRCRSSGLKRRFARGTEAGFAVSLINKKLGLGDPLAQHIEAVKKGEEPISFGPNSPLVDYGKGWRLQTVTQLDSTEVGGGEEVLRPTAVAFPAVTVTPQQDTSTRSSGVAVDNGWDNTHEFITSQVFKSRDGLVNWTRARGRSCGVGVVIKRSDAVGQNRLRRARINFGCDRGGYYPPKSDADSDGRQAMTSDADTDRRKKRCPKAKSKKKCGCPFALKGIHIGPGDEWKLAVVCGMHNHLSAGMEEVE